MLRKLYPSPISFDRVRKMVVFDINGDKLAVATNAVQSAFRNVESSPILITDAILVVDTVSSGACTIDIGSATTVAENDAIFDGINVASGGSTIVVMRDAALDSAANINVKEVAIGSYITVKEKSGDAEGLRAKLYIEYVVK